MRLKSNILIIFFISFTFSFSNDKYISFVLPSEAIYTSQLPRTITIPIFLENVKNDVYGTVFSFYYPKKHIKKDSITVKFHNNVNKQTDRLGISMIDSTKGIISILVRGGSMNYFINDDDTLASVNINLSKSLKHNDSLDFSLESGNESHSIDTLGQKSYIYCIQSGYLKIIDSAEAYHESVKNSIFVGNEIIRIAILPNPNRGNFCMEFDQEFFKKITNISVINNGATPILQQKPTNNPEYISIPNPISGIYFVSVHLDTGKIITIKVPVLIE